MNKEFEKIVGYESIKRELDQICDILSNPEKYRLLGLERMIQRETVKDLYKLAEECLSEYEKTVFLRYIHGYTPRTIAPLVGRSEKSVSNAIARMLSKLRARLI